MFLAFRPPCSLGAREPTASKPLKMRQKVMPQYCMGVWKSQQIYEKNGRYTLNQCPSWFQKSTSTKATWFRTCGRPS